MLLWLVNSSTDLNQVDSNSFQHFCRYDRLLCVNPIGYRIFTVDFDRDQECWIIHDPFDFSDDLE